MAHTAKEILDALSYCHDTGALFWRERSRGEFPSDKAFKFWNTKYAGRPALTAVGTGGYCAGKLNGKYLSAHRAAFAVMTGSVPSGDIDHIDGNRLNNRWGNLRVVTRSENCSNRAMHKNNTSGEVGVSFDSKSRKWRAKIRGSVIGLFDDFSDAATARRLAVAIDGGFTERHGY